MTLPIALALGVLALTIVLLATEALRVDVVAIVILLLLPWLGLIEPKAAFMGLSSGAVVSMAAVMVLGRGVDRAGVTRAMAKPALRWAGASESRLLTVVMGAVGSLSAFMQNIGAAALFLPAVNRMARQAGYSARRLLMPMGFAAILGGTVSMIGSGPLILLGDLLQQRGLEPFGLFDVTPYGLTLLVGGILFFAAFGRFVLPAGSATDAANQSNNDLASSWQLSSSVHELFVPADSRLVGKARDEIGLKGEFDLHLVALHEAGDVQRAPWRHTRFGGEQTLAILGTDADVARFATEFGLVRRDPPVIFGALQAGERAGFAEALVSPRAEIVGQSIRDFGFRKTYGLEPVLLLSGGEPVRADFSDTRLRAGDTLVVYGEWERMVALDTRRDFTLITDLEIEDLDERQRWPAILCFVGAITLALCGFSLALSLTTGALCMVLFGVLSIDTAYRAIDWRTILLIAGLIPLGSAMESTGAAAYLADFVVQGVQGAHGLVVLGAIGALATLFTLFMSNVAATVVLVPIVVGLGPKLQLDPRLLALLVGVCASNSFILPTHQVNALVLGAGGYRNKDYLRAGGVMSALFLIVLVVMIYASMPAVTAPG